jgi:eukaryotic translation initiation factor 2C
MLSGDQAADMIKHAAQRPMDRSASIKQWFRKLDYASKPLLQQWGLEVRNQMMEVDARVLPAPKVTYRNNKTLNCQFGGWNLRGVSFTRPGNALKSWGVLSLDGYFRTPDMARFITFFNNEISKYGVRVENKQPPLVEGDPRKGLKANLQEVCREAYMKAKANPQLILIIMPVSRTLAHTL